MGNIFVQAIFLQQTFSINNFTQKPLIDDINLEYGFGIINNT